MRHSRTLTVEEMLRTAVDPHEALRFETAKTLDALGAELAALSIVLEDFGHYLPLMPRRAVTKRVRNCYDAVAVIRAAERVLAGLDD